MVYKILDLRNGEYYSINGQNEFSEYAKALATLDVHIAFKKLCLGYLSKPKNPNLETLYLHYFEIIES